MSGISSLQTFSLSESGNLIRSSGALIWSLLWCGVVIVVVGVGYDYAPFGIRQYICIRGKYEYFFYEKCTNSTVVLSITLQIQVFIKQTERFQNGDTIYVTNSFNFHFTDHIFVVRPLLWFVVWFLGNSCWILHKFPCRCKILFLWIVCLDKPPPCCCIFRTYRQYRQELSSQQPPNRSEEPKNRG